MNREVSVVTFNIHKGRSPLGRKRTLMQIRYLLEAVNPDIVCLQEVSSRFLPESQREFFATQLEFLTATVWPHSCYQKNAIYPSGHHGNAILSRWPLKLKGVEDLSLNSFEKRGIVHVEAQHPTGNALQVLCTHLNLRQRDRAVQVQRIGRYLAKMRLFEEAVILCGDLNDWRCQIDFDGQLREAFETLRGRTAKTFPSLFPLLQLDRIYFRNLYVKEVELLQRPRLILCSDHLALKAVFQVP